MPCKILGNPFSTNKLFPMVFDEAKFQHELSGARQGLRRDLREAFAAMNAAPWLKAVKVGWFEVEDMKEPLVEGITKLHELATKLPMSRADQTIKWSSLTQMHSQSLSDFPQT